jgi:hypothetical protein
MGADMDDVKRRLRLLKKHETELRFKNKPPDGRDDFVWNVFFSTKGDSTVKYPLSALVCMGKEEFNDVISAYYSMVYYLYYKENGILDRDQYDPALLYELGLPPDATSGEIKKRFRELAKLVHPDCGGDSGSFIRLMGIYQKLIGDS